MACGKLLNSWLGPGRTYYRALLDIVSPHETSRFFPFRMMTGLKTVMALSGQNRSGISWEQAFGLQTAEEISRQQNFKW
jgi:hypothetical protein